MKTKLVRFGWTIALGMVVEAMTMPLGAQEIISEPSPFTTVELDQRPSLVQMQEVRLEPSGAGLEIILVTTGGTLSSPNLQTVGNALIIDLPNAVMALPGGQGFEEVSPTADIAFVSVTQITDNQVRLAITGVNGPPEADVKPNSQGLQLLIRPGVAGTSAEIEESEALQIVVSATRTEEEIANIPRSVTVIERAEIEQQTQVYSSLADILGQLVPGLAPSTGSASQFGQALRGRNVLVLIDGVPQTTNRNAFRDLQTIAPSAIERIEVIQGPTAIYGDGATGGVINIITRGPAPEPFLASTRLAINTDFDSVSNSLGGMVEQYVGGTLDYADYAFTASYESVGGFFDALGNRIPPDPNGQGGVSDTDSFNVLGKLGINMTDEQRLQITINHFQATQNTDFTVDPSITTIAGRQRSQAIDGLDLDTPQTSNNTVVSLDYSHSNVLNGNLKGQIYYRDYLTRFFPFDGRASVSLGNSIFQSEIDSTEWGGRLQLDTPLTGEKNLRLLWGADYNNESTAQPVNIFDPVTFDSSGGLSYRNTGKRTWVPSLNQDSLGLFGQLNWRANDWLTLLGGIRHEQVGLSVDDFTTLGGNAVQGGDLSYDATLFNLGGVVDVTDNISLFASFAQGFSLADVGLVLRNAPVGFSLATLQPEAQRVNNYEIGVRGNWQNLRFSLAGFYNSSDLGTTFTAPGEILRAPERVYGVEATMDARVGESWQLGGTFSLSAGEIDRLNTGNYTPLDGFRIAPVKLTAYVQHQTTPGWQNRLQLLYSGDRDVFSNNTVFGQLPVSSYVTLDYISRINVGPGKLEIGIANLLNTDYFPVVSQLQPNELSNAAARGRFLRIGYAFEW